MKFDPVHNFRHWCISMMLAALTGLFTSYCIMTVTSWDIDNEFSNLYPHMTLVQWINVNQVQHVQKMLHDLW